MENFVKNSIKAIKKETIYKIVIATSILLIALFMIYANSLHIINKQLIRNNVYIDNINISKLTKQQAYIKIQETKDINLKNASITFIYKDYTKSISISNLFYLNNTNLVIEQAYNLGRDKNKLKNILNYFIKTTPTYLSSITTTNTTIIDNIVNDISTDIDTPIDNSFIKVFTDRVIVHIGSSSYTVNKTLLKNKIISQLDNNNYKDIKVDVLSKFPFTVTTDKICELVEYNIAYYKNDNSVSITNCELNKKVDSKYIDYLLTKYIDFTIDIEINQNILKNNFDDQLTSYATSLPVTSTNEFNRSVNIALAANKIDKTILYPGDVFSYNQIVGQRTSSKGYKTAHVYVNGKIVDGIGGGICQVSTTLYNAVLNIGLEVIERHYHQFTVDYANLGQDAAISYGYQDFKFKNTTSHPIKIECVINDVLNDTYTSEIIIEKQILTCNILGVDENTNTTYKYRYNILSERPYETIIQYDASYKHGYINIIQQGHYGYSIETIKETYINNIKSHEQVISYSYYKPYPQIEIHGNS